MVHETFLAAAWGFDRISQISEYLAHEFILDRLKIVDCILEDSVN